MREILFRAKRKNWRNLPKEEWWVEGSYHHQTDYYGDPCDKHYIIDGTETDMEGYGEHYEIDSETLCQCTGKSDEDGKKIFEGDIVGFMDLYSTENGYSEKSCLGKVFWDEEECCFHVTNRLSAESWEVLEWCKVVGNVFDNKEMYRFVNGISDTDDINYRPKCGQKIYSYKSNGEAVCDECGFQFTAIECDGEEE